MQAERHPARGCRPGRSAVYPELVPGRLPARHAERSGPTVAPVAALISQSGSGPVA